MHKKTLLVLGLIVGLVFCIRPAYANFIVDWGITPGIWTPNSTSINYIQEDFVGDYGYVNPGYGGQKFDAEALYVKYTGSSLQFAVVAGAPPDLQSYSSWYSGDVAFDFGNGYAYGVETTGLTQGGTPGTVAGKLYNVTSWGQGLWGGASAPTEILAINGTGMDINSFMYGQIGNSDHYFIQGEITLAALLAKYGTFPSWGNNVTLHWTQTCGNDSIQLTTRAIPEPATLSLFGLGLLGLGALRRRGEKK
jgi:hypothetical protein